jgi:hypothetical protein
VNEKLSLKKPDAQNQNVTRPGNLPISLIGSSDSTSSTRKMLQSAELVFRDTAVPPLSPPGLDDKHRHHSE